MYINKLPFVPHFSDFIAKSIENEAPLDNLLRLSKMKYSFAGGLPSQEAFPVEDILRITSDTIKKDSSILQYGVTPGEKQLIEGIVTLTKRYDGIEVKPENIVTTIGAQHGIFMVGFAFLSDKGSSLVVGDPTYIGALEAFNLFQPKYITVKVDDKGMDTEELKKVLELNKDIQFVYTMPEFQNPTGTTQPLEKRKKIIELAKKHKVLIVEDSPYRDVRCTGNQLPTIFSMYPEGTIYIKTASKIAVPSLRVGWVIANEKIIKALTMIKSASIMFSPRINEVTVASYLNERIKKGCLVDEKSIEHYRLRRKNMLNALGKYMNGLEVSWTKPEGGFVLWFKLPEGLDSEELLKYAIKKEVSFIPGKYFYAEPDKSPKNSMRLAYGLIPVERIEEGVKLLAESIKEYLSDKRG